MDALLTWWAMLDPDRQTEIIGLLAGIALWLLQRLATVLPIPGLHMDTPNAAKLATAIVAAAIGALVLSGGETQQWLVQFVAALLASQTVQAASKGLSPGKPDPDPLQTTVDDDV